MAKRSKSKARKRTKKSTSTKRYRGKSAKKSKPQVSTTDSKKLVVGDKIPKLNEKRDKKKRIKTGIKNLDSKMQGGLKDGTVTIAIGDVGSCKTIFAIQFLMEGLKSGETCLYLTFEEKKEKLYDNFQSFGWRLDEYEKKKRLFFLEYNPEQVKMLIEEGGGTVDQLIQKYKISRLVIDSITSFSLLYQDELARKESGLALFELINKWGCTAVLTSQAILRNYELESTSLGFEADNIILLYHFKKGEKRIRAIEILKMRGTNHTNRILKLMITPKGLAVK
jgi:circadian clock protein KaiC